MNSKFLLGALLAAATLCACSDEENAPKPPVVPTDEIGSAFILNQGNQGNQLPGTLDLLSFSSEASEADTYTSDLFGRVNNASLGDAPQDGVVYGSRLYIAMFGANRLWVVNRKTAEIETYVDINAPEGLCAADGFVYVTGNDGYLTRVDTLTMTVKGKIEVGPNPVGVAAAGASLYVAISDGYNYEGGYANGKRIAKVSRGVFRVERYIACGLNPTQVVSDAAGNVFVVAMGDYGNVAPKCQRITADDRAVDFCPASSVAVRLGKLAALYNYTNWATMQSTLTCKLYDLSTGACINDAFIAPSDLPASPYNIDVNPENGDTYIGANAAPYDFSSPGYMYRYDSDGHLVTRYTAGVAPIAAIFNK